MLISLGYAQPIHDGAPNVSGVVAMDKKVINRFHVLFTKEGIRRNLDTHASPSSRPSKSYFD
jgi:hypothetical protein